MDNSNCSHYISKYDRIQQEWNILAMITRWTVTSFGRTGKYEYKCALQQGVWYDKTVDRRKSGRQMKLGESDAAYDFSY